MRHTLAICAKPGTLVLWLVLAACGPNGNVAAGDPPGATAGARGAGGEISACKLITPGDIERISGYSGAVRRDPSSDTSCWMTVDDQRLGVSISIGPYVPTPFLGGRDVELERGIRGRVSDAGWLNTIILPDDTAITLLIDGTALVYPTGHEDYRITLGDGREVALSEQYDAYAKTILSRLP